MERYYQQDIECAPYEEIRKIQSEKLVKQVKHVWDNVPYYRKKMEEKGVTPDDIKSVDDLHKLPFLFKKDLRDAYPYGLLGKPLKDCVVTPHREQQEKELLLITHSMISTFGKTAAHVRSWQQAEQMKT